MSNVMIEIDGMLNITDRISTHKITQVDVIILIGRPILIMIMFVIYHLCVFFIYTQHIDAYG